MDEYIRSRSITFSNRTFKKTVVYAASEREKIREYMFSTGICSVYCEIRFVSIRCVSIRFVNVPYRVNSHMSNKITLSLCKRFATQCSTGRFFA
jgi:hypothetical protein